MTRDNEVIEKSWWCTFCFALIEIEPADVGVPHVVDHYAEPLPFRPH